MLKLQLYFIFFLNNYCFQYLGPQNRENWQLRNTPLDQIPHKHHSRLIFQHTRVYFHLCFANQTKNSWNLAATMTFLLRQKRIHLFCAQKNENWSSFYYEYILLSFISYLHYLTSVNPRSAKEDFLLTIL